jgi:hypothetical protein
MSLLIPSDPKRTTQSDPKAIEMSSSGCYAQSQVPIGLWVNGVAIYSASSGTTYNNSGQWHYIDQVLDKYDRDICSGRSDAAGEYFHRSYSSCLSDRVGDDGLGHSPVYGWMVTQTCHNSAQNCHDLTRNCNP